MPESSGLLVDTGSRLATCRGKLRRCDVMMLIPRLLAAGFFIS